MSPQNCSVYFRLFLLLFNPYLSRCNIGPGTFGVSPDFTHVFFDEDLLNRMNKKLADFLFTSLIKYPDIDDALLVVREN